VIGSSRVVPAKALLTGSVLALVAVFAPSPAAATEVTPNVDVASCVSTPTVPVKTPLGHIRSVAQNDCDIYAIFWVMRYDSADQTGWRTINERWVTPRMTSVIDIDCRGTGTFSYKAIMWDPNMMGYHVTAAVQITC
jgi:hypothetical protein